MKVTLSDIFSVFGDSLSVFWTRDVGTQTLIEAGHEVVRRMRWISPGSLSTAHWTLFCDPPGELTKRCPLYGKRITLHEREVGCPKCIPKVYHQNSAHIPCLSYSSYMSSPSYLP